jgi:hypothetical protein
MHTPPTNGNFCGEHGNAIVPRIILDHNWHMAYGAQRQRGQNGKQLLDTTLRHGNGQRHYFFACWTSQFWTASSMLEWLTCISDLPLCGVWLKRLKAYVAHVDHWEDNWFQRNKLLGLR